MILVGMARFDERNISWVGLISKARIHAGAAADDAAVIRPREVVIVVAARGGQVVSVGVRSGSDRNGSRGVIASPNLPGGPLVESLCPTLRAP